jgi:hypothetical protein
MGMSARIHSLQDAAHLTCHFSLSNLAFMIASAFASTLAWPVWPLPLPQPCP